MRIIDAGGDGAQTADRSRVIDAADIGSTLWLEFSELAAAACLC